MRAFCGGLGALLILSAAAPVDAEAQNRRTRDRLDEIEAQLADLQGAVFGDATAGAPVRFEGANPNGPAGEAPADITVRIGSIERELQRLTGEVERLSFQMRQQQDQMRRLVTLAYPEYEGDIGLGLDAAPGGGAPAPGGPVDLVGGSAVGQSLGDFSDPETAYAAGRSALLEARYDDAERAFLVVTEEFPDSDRAGDATFYLAETYLAQGDLGAAARSYLDFIRNYPESPRAAEAHLKLGQAFARADKTTEACRVWQRGLQQYPDMDATLKQRMTDMREATCR